MAVHIDDIREQALALPEDERRQLAIELEATLTDADYEQAWCAEAARRAEAIDNGGAQTIPVDEAFAKAHAALKTQ